MKFIDKTLILYGLIGILNTIIGYGTMFSLVFYGVMPEIANTLGNLAGFINSYLLNKRFTFKSKHSHKKDFIRFSLVTFISYLLNLCVLVICFRILGMNEYIALILASIVYVISGYLLHKFWTFKTKSN